MINGFFDISILHLFPHDTLIHLHNWLLDGSNSTQNFLEEPLILALVFGLQYRYQRTRSRKCLGPVNGYRCHPCDSSPTSPVKRRLEELRASAPAILYEPCPQSIPDQNSRCCINVRDHSPAAPAITAIVSLSFTQS